MAASIDAAAPRPPRLRTLRLGAVSLRIDLRVLLLIAVAAAGTFALACWAMTLGSFPIAVVDVVRSVLGQGSDEYDFVVRTLRLPRVLSAVLAGALLALSGAVFQGLVRNALVSPDIIGINAGASLFAVFWILTLRSSALLPVAAFVGAVLAAVLVYVLTWKGGVSGNRLILVGIGVNAMCAAATTFLIVRFPIDDVSRAVLWTTGSVYASSWGDVALLGAGLAVLLPAGAVLMWAMRVLQLGDQTARSLGQAVERTRLTLMLVGCGLSAVAISIVGPIGFVAFMLPHVARMVAGPMSGGVFVFTAMLGGAYLLAADVVAQHALPVSLPVGVVTSALGAPYFLFLLWRTNARL
ncbi:MAG: iron chelate uptake ABC transporter family permease subunit [Dehalococcoidia bacterium]|nr:iron chelate uptake ABC transporter family permease subunit [Dehalococcoidia bacterium]